MPLRSSELWEVEVVKIILGVCIVIVIISLLLYIGLFLAFAMAGKIMERMEG